MQNGKMRVIVPPAVEPVTLAEARDQVRQDFTTSDAELARLIKSAREWAEDYMRRFIVQRTCELRLPCFNAYAIELPGGNVATVDSISYVDGGGANQDFTDFVLDEVSVPALIHPSYGNRWPSSRWQPDAVTITYRAGFAPAGSPIDYTASIPESIRHAILLHIEAHYDRDGRDMPALIEAAGALLYPHRIQT